MTEIELHLSTSSAKYTAGSTDAWIDKSNTNNDVNPPWHKTVANQWLLLMKKNIILSTRSKFMAIFQLIAPILFMLVLFGVNTYVNDAIASTPENGKVIDPPPSVIGLIPRCYRRLNDPSAQCITIAYAPSNNVTDLLVSRVVEKNNIPNEEVMSFDSPDDLDDFILAHGNTTQAAYVFLNWGNGTFEYALQFNDTVVCTIGITNTCRNPRIGVAIPMAASMDREIMNLQLSDQPTNNQSTNSISYQVSLMQFPQPKQTYDSGVVPIFLLAAIMFNFVILAKTLVQEKETRLLEGMKMMGLLELPYWSSWFLHYTVIMLLCVFMLFVAGHIFSFLLFTNNDFGVVFFTLFIFSLSMIAMAFLLTAVMTSAQNTATVGFILWIVFCAVFITINTSLYVEDNSVSGSVQSVVSLISPFVFSKGISVLNNAAQGEGNGVSWARRGDHAFARYWPATRVWNFLILDTFIYLILAWWITNVFPGDFGVPKPFYFFLTRSYWLGSRGKNSSGKKVNVKKVQIDDEDVIKEEGIVNSGNFLPDTVVVVDDLIKIYGRGKKQFVANKGISFTMQNNQLFCLLGPNGAGKTTLFNMLTGLFPSSGGDATIFGYSINSEMDKIRRLMGVCPQHDLLWGDLSGRQHLDFFCRFKNMSKESIESEIEERLREVGLTDIADVPTSAYSGGEKRRLSVALAITGNPKIVFLDEPTTGMDPVSRHQVWEIISRAKANRLLVLTTHSMEEADHLSDRIGIVAHGQLRCLGTNIHLKNKFGIGYQLMIFFNPADDGVIKQNITHHLQEHLSTWTQYISEVNAPGNLTLRIPHDMTHEIPILLQNLEDNSARLGINELSMNLSSLEEVFLKIASETLTETSISLNDLSTSNDELAAMMAYRKDSFINETPYKQQLEAISKKTVSGYLHNWKTLAFQFGIAVLLVLIMLALSVPSSNHVASNPHPLIIPPPFQRATDPTIHTEIPFFVSQTSGVNMGSCCKVNESSGFLGNVDFSILNNSNAQASLGKFYPTSAFTFTQYSTAAEMYQHIYNDPSNWVTGYYFEEITENSLSVRVFENLTVDFETYATLGWVNLISNAYFREITNNPNNSIIIRVKPFPTNNHTDKEIQAASEATWIVLGSSFIMVMVLSAIVREKKERQRYLMQMAGLRMSAYWLVMFGINMLIYWVYLLFYYGISAAALLRIFSLSSPRIIIPTYFVFAFNQLGLAFLLSSFAADPHSASLATYIYIVALVIATSYINPVFVDTSVFTKSSVLYGTAVIPHIAYGRVISALVFYYYTDYVAMTWDLFTQLPHIYHMLTILCCMGVFFYIFHQYIERIFPSEYHQAERPYFFLLPSYWRKTKKPIYIVEANKAEPEDVKGERTGAIDNPDLPVRVPGITKVFRGDKHKVVVDNLALTVGKTECLALIGPNGSGKTTFINIITGLYPVTSGDAVINGSSIVSDINEAQRYMGVCPQDSVLYNELTGREHLLLFGRLRNLKGEDLEKAVDLALKQVLLTDAQNRQAGGYSGGMKRRLSLAISLIGNPPVVMLDEPTTGVDPFSRRVVWDVIQSYKKYSSILLVTHSMEEAESLADRVAMVSEGSLRCVGRPIELKERYGVGYNLTIMHAGNTEQLITFVKSLVPSGKVLQVVGNSCILFSLPKQEVKLSVLFSAIQSSKDDLRITDWGILQSSLEDVLLQAIGVFGTAK